jgi:hypothetical protein
MRIDLAETVQGVAPDRALDWWMDFQDGHEDHAFVPGSRRKLLERTPDAAVFEESIRPLGIPLFHERVRVRREGRAARFDGANTYATFEGEYAFEEAPDGGTVARLRAAVTLKKPWKAPRAVVERVLRQDLKGHLRQMGKDIGRRAGGRVDQVNTSTGRLPSEEDSGGDGGAYRRDG